MINKGKFKKIIKSLMPPFLLELLKDKSFHCQYDGVYFDWSEAKKKTSGYEDDKVLEKVLAAAVKVDSGEAIFERDSVLFNHVEYSWPLLAALLLAAARDGGELNVLDFGGALGTTYRQNKKFLDQLGKVTWNIVEQEKTVAAGQANIKEKNIKFWTSLDECLEKEKINLIIFSASIQYIENPYDILGKILKKGIPDIIVDRLVVSEREDFITIQTVPKTIYEASYPLWIFNENKFKEFFQASGYALLEEFPDLISGIIKAGGQTAEHRGYIFQLIKQ
jgi:putative methyltransferase (TIGR04325 family)